MTDTADLTLDELRAALAPAVAANAAFDGWSDEAVDRAAEEIGADPLVARLAFNEGPVQMIDAWFATIDDAMTATLPPETLGALKIRGRINALVTARLEALAPDREALRRALAILALPTNAPRAARLAWRSADLMWRLASDRAVDLNHYTKRTTLIALYAATLLVFLDDESEEFADTRAFLGRRIDGVMAFERFKARWNPANREHFSLARFVGRLRYPV